MFRKICCAFLSLLCLVGCEKKKETEEKALIVITSPDSPPFEYKDTAHGGEIIGFDIDVIQELGKQLGRPVQIIETDFSSLIPSLQAGRADMAIAYLTPTDERRKSVDFSEPYYVNKIDLLVPNSSPIVTEQDLENKKLGVQLGSVNEIIAQTWTQEIPGLTLVSLNKIGDLVLELKNGRVQAVLMEAIVAKNIAEANPGLKVVSLEKQGEGVAIAFPKGSPWVKPTNEALKKMQGNIDQFAIKWFGQ